MKATKEYYLSHRLLFMQLGYLNEVSKLDVHFNVVIIKNKLNQIILIR